MILASAKGIKITFAKEVPCDLLCLGKALGGGFPVSACFGTKSVMDAWPKSSGEALHTGTFFGHPLSCAVGLETLKTISKQKLCLRSERIGKDFLDKLRQDCADFVHIKEIRGMGLMIGVEFVKDAKKTKAKEESTQLVLEAFKRGLLLLPCGENSVRLSPALNVTKDQCDVMLDIWEESLAAVEKQMNN
jgi:4-aminobutyrate aminotransferase-like enzyme